MDRKKKKKQTHADTHTKERKEEGGDDEGDGDDVGDVDDADDVDDNNILHLDCAAHSIGTIDRVDLLRQTVASMGPSLVSNIYRSFGEG